MRNFGTRSFACYHQEHLLNYTLRKKKCDFPTFLRGEFSLFYRYSNFWVLQENCEQFWNRFFTYCIPRTLAKWNALKSSSIYTLPKKKRKFPCCVSFEGECIFTCNILTHSNCHKTTPFQIHFLWVTLCKAWNVENYTKYTYGEYSTTNLKEIWRFMVNILH